MPSKKKILLKNMKLSVPDYISSIKPYVPGKPIEALEREYGIVDSIKLASNENPLGPSPKAVEAIKHALGKLNRYPDGSGHNLIQKISEHLGFSPQNIVLGNGSDEIIGMLACAFLQPGDEVILPRPSFLMYEIMVLQRRCNTGVCSFEIAFNRSGKNKEKITSKTRMVFLCNPNNPTGTIVSKNDFENFLKKIPPEVIVVVDEAYIEFVRDQNCARSIDYIDNTTTVGYASDLFQSLWSGRTS